MQRSSVVGAGGTGKLLWGVKEKDVDKSKQWAAMGGAGAGTGAGRRSAIVCGVLGVE